MNAARQKPIDTPDMIVFDLDGTFTNISDRAARLSSVSDRWNVPISSTTHWMLQKANELYKNIGIRNRFAEAIRDDVMDLLCAEKQDMFVVLQTAFSKDIPCSLLSNGPRQWGERVLDRLQIRPFFDHALFREDVAHLKPAPEALLSLLDQNALAQDKTVWVCGDRTADVFLALNANAASPCRIVPVAIEGSKAAGTITALREKYNITGHVFDKPFDIACAIDPDLEDRLTDVLNRMQIRQHSLASFRIQ